MFSKLFLLTFQSLVYLFIFIKYSIKGMIHKNDGSTVIHSNYNHLMKVKLLKIHFACSEVINNWYFIFLLKFNCYYKLFLIVICISAYFLLFVRLRTYLTCNDHPLMKSKIRKIHILWSKFIDYIFMIVLQCILILKL